jgi:hypothetical protein
MDVSHYLSSVPYIKAHLAFQLVHLTALFEAVGRRALSVNSATMRFCARRSKRSCSGMVGDLTKIRQLCEAVGHLLQYLVDVRAWHQSHQLLVFFDKRCLTTQDGLHFGKFD